MRIRELAERLQVSPRAIRFYEESGLIAPKRDDASGYRLFSEEDAWRLQTIVALREMGMSVKQMRAVLDEIDHGSTDKVTDYLEWQRQSLYAQWLEIADIIEQLESAVMRYRAEGVLHQNDLVRAVKGIRGMRQARENWEDRWHFDDLASKFDEQVAQVSNSLAIYYD
ncbi:MerR family transcriptional regulator [Alicyclobacillus acidoterrestris]|uniref:MerR family transcriptional regulator n=1 Tax=Alicyclobacillus acidoterrestris (strain ATCC 49025 / DSM 3922 / CIP 106132 / NCIMB 13137 / GD3B) TaxID=1356854 RepID=A0A9E6ZXC8_ALIAG|nr:MerR family transcriptional regulator [Alicyclobacillus acidoterrestris]UNO50899.1 MerR family transcriptional regulator [Alicyclobacillus acidoterrestris]